MFKSLADNVWAFDVEWVPDPMAGRALHNLPEAWSDLQVIQEMWRHGGATDDDPMPYLKTAICRVVSIAAVVRVAHNGEVKLHLRSLPRDPRQPRDTAEATMLHTFLNAIGRQKPQLVGFNSQASDLKILLQRSLAQGIQAPEFCQRPNKPWEGVDYFARGSEAHIDLLELLGGWGKSTPSLHQIAVVCGIPGKMDTDGQQVAQLWLQGELRKIIAYNEFDALTTYLLWLRMAHFAGFFSSEQYEEEQQLLRQLLQSEALRPERQHLQQYLRAWDSLRARQAVWADSLESPGP